MGLFYFGARYYDPEIGVWTSTDPQEQFWNPYAYTTSPVMYTDPNGEIFPFVAFFWTMAGVGAVTGGAIAAANGGAGWDIFEGAFYGLGAGMLIGAAPFALQGVFSGGGGAYTSVATSAASGGGGVLQKGTSAYNLIRTANDLTGNHGVNELAMGGDSWMEKQAYVDLNSQDQQKPENDIEFFPSEQDVFQFMEHQKYRNKIRQKENVETAKKAIKYTGEVVKAIPEFIDYQLDVVGPDGPTKGASGIQMIYTIIKHAGD